MKKMVYLDGCIAGIFLLLLSCDVLLKMQGLLKYINFVYLGFFLIRAVVMMALKQRNYSSDNNLSLNYQWGNLLREFSLLLGLLVAVSDSI